MKKGHCKECDALFSVQQTILEVQRVERRASTRGGPNKARLRSLLEWLEAVAETEVTCGDFMAYAKAIGCFVGFASTLEGYLGLTSSLINAEVAEDPTILRTRLLLLVGSEHDALLDNFIERVTGGTL